MNTIDLTKGSDLQQKNFCRYWPFFPVNENVLICSTVLTLRWRSRFAIVSNIAITTLKFVNRWKQRCKGMESLNLKKLLNRFLYWKIPFVLYCGNDLLTDLHKHFLKFKENVPKNGRTNNSLLGTFETTCLGTYNLSINFLILWSIILTG